MEKFSRVPFFFFFVYIFILSFPEPSFSQLSTAENEILYQVQEFLEYPEALKQWNNWTNFCYLPPSTSLTIVCSNNHITELTVIGNKSSPSSPKILSPKFSIDSFFTVLTKLSNLKTLSLVSLGVWGPLPDKISRFSSLEVLNISSNSIYGEIPSSVSTLSNLKSLILNDNLFNGSVPDLKGLNVLQELNLGNNHFQSKFPSLGNNLVNIILKNNSFRSEIPSALSKFNRLETLDISSNKFAGPIPSPLFSLPSIQYLNLAKNQLSGTLSANITCNAKLGFVDISNNLLMGKLPTCIGSNATNRKVISTWNCLMNSGSKYQHLYRFCHKEALAVKPPSMKEKKQSTVKLGFVLAIIGGIVGIAVVLGALFFVIYRKTEKIKANKEYKCDSFVFEKNSVLGSPIVDGRGQNRPNTMRRMATFGLPSYHNFTLEEMEEATNNFDPSNLVQEGSQGQLYKGWLRDGSTVLVKCLKIKQKHSLQTLQQHIEVISKLRHRHLVSVLGHCIVTYMDHPNTASTVFIVLEYITNGSLRDHLTDWRSREVLKWPQRMGITMGIARGIQYLHNGIAPGIFGNDLKIENILLDESLTPRISSYNISLPSKVGSESPLHGQDTPNIRLGRSENAEKDDIYQLGVILLEVITGRSVNTKSELEDLKQRVEMSLVESPAKLKDATDPSIRGTFAYDSLKTTVQITMNCLCKEASMRPSIDDVLWHMQYSSQVQQGWGTSSGNLSGRIN